MAVRFGLGAAAGVLAGALIFRDHSKNGTQSNLVMKQAELKNNAQQGGISSTSAAPPTPVPAPPAVHEPSSNRLRDGVQKIVEQFNLSAQKMEEIIADMSHEMTKGLSGPAQIRMLPSYVTQLPTGDEKGDVLALDLGGSNFRVVRVSLGGEGRCHVQQRRFVIPLEAMKGDASTLFGFIADRVNEATFSQQTDTNASDQSLSLGFTFSFPVDQHALDKGDLIAWTKEFDVEGCVGKDVVALLQKEFDARKMNVKIRALVNDTVGTLLSKALTDTKCGVGVILGTGTNACYIEKSANILKLPPQDKKGDMMIINTEWGAYNGKVLPFTHYDTTVDAHSNNAGEQIFEKMISGKYIGEVARLACLSAINDASMFGGQVTPQFSQHFKMSAECMSRIEEDCSPTLTQIDSILALEFGVANSTLEERKSVQSIVGAVSTRAARLSALGIMCLLRKMETSDVTVAIDGSVFKCYRMFAARLHGAMAELNTHSQLKYDVVVAEDGSGIGAGAAAIMATEN